MKRAVDRGIPVATVNLGRTRADAEITVKVEARCGETLEALVRRIASTEADC